ncbi:cell wall-binding repeat-containing protein [Leifsonia poae]|uniref:Uncharacterized protein n=2 Tax=Actinomycetes TaxID=1760 RepID=A0A9W6LZW8_9MICO|nr:cell wall-binding repeat-containing protein [Leifsonia poae]GLJ76320.1 hypothetical protein GCM10017584_18940 [Leifsonia poae]
MKVSKTGAGIVFATIIAGLLGATPAIASEEPTPHSTSTPSGPSAPDAHMGDYSASRFVDQAAQLPDDLVSAVQRDLGVTPEQYLATAAATVDAGQVISDLTGDGVHVSDARLDGTQLVVDVATKHDVASVTSRGADAVVGSGAGREVFSGKKFTALADLVNGTGWAFVDGPYWDLCSIGFNGFSVSTGASQFATAGHCLRTASNQSSPLPTPFMLTQPTAGSTSLRAGSPIGSMIDASFEFGGGYDSGLVAVTNKALTPKPRVATWGGGKGAQTAGSPVAVYGQTSAVAGTLFCKSGRTTGWTCGKVTDVDQYVDVYDDNDVAHTVNAYITTACALPGDSGGSAMAGNYAIGVLSASDAPNGTKSCSSAIHSAFFPIIGQYESIADQQPDWELAVSLSTPTVFDPSGVVFTGHGLQGTLPNGIPGDTVYLYLDGASSPTSQVAIAKGSTAFSLPLTGAARGKHTYRVVAGWGVRSRSTAVTGTVTIAATPAVDRIAAADRYSEAVAIANAGYPTTADVVYVASGETFPDALSAAPAAAAGKGPLLLTAKSTLPASVKAKIATLSPAKIVIVGGTGSVSAAVEKTLSAIAPVKRYAGADRYAASRGLVDGVFGKTGVPTLYLATGSNFPDALSAGAAAGSTGSAVLLVNGAKPTLDAATLALIAKLHPAAIRIAGGAGSVSAGIEKSLAGKAASVKRLGGADRYAASQTINTDAFPAASKVYVASGVVFPDALAGAVLAAKGAAPLYVSQTNCLSAGIIAGIARLGVGSVTLLGGTGSLTARVQSLTSCTS